MRGDDETENWKDKLNCFNNNPFDCKGIYIEIDDPTHRKPERRIDDNMKEDEIFSSSFPLLSFTYNEIFNNTEQVMNKIEGCIEAMRCA